MKQYTRDWSVSSDLVDLAGGRIAYDLTEASSNLLFPSSSCTYSLTLISIIAITFLLILIDSLGVNSRHSGHFIPFSLVVIWNSMQ